MRADKHPEFRLTGIELLIAELAGIMHEMGSPDQQTRIEELLREYSRRVHGDFDNE